MLLQKSLILNGLNFKTIVSILEHEKHGLTILHVKIKRCIRNFHQLGDEDDYFVSLERQLILFLIDVKRNN